MATILSINNLNYKVDNNMFFQDLNLEIENNSFTSILGPNGCGKTMLTKIICAIYPTYDVCLLDGISLNKEKVLKYITKIGIVTNDFKNPFLYKKVSDELIYPLSNLGYSENKIEKTIHKLLSFFNMEDIIDEDINNLSDITKSKLLIIISLLHNPKVLVLDDVFLNMNSKDKIFIIDKLIELQKKGLTIINITSDLESVYPSNQIYILNGFKIEKKLTLEELLENETYLTKLGLKIPFTIELSLKLNTLNLLDKPTFDLKILEENLWK